MPHYLNKAKLYMVVNLMREALSIDLCDYPLCVPALCEEEDVIVKLAPFKTKGLRGVAALSDENFEQDIILLNKNRNGNEMNFDCAHELFHLMVHRDEEIRTFNCFEKARPNQDPFLEWQANEGGAEFILPYELLLPIIKDEMPKWSTWYKFESFKQALAQDFNISTAVVEYRIDCLKYEINQYVKGVPLKELEFLSKKQRKERGLDGPSLNDVSKRLYNEDILKWHGNKI